LVKRFVVAATVWAMGLAWVLGGLAPVGASAQVPAAVPATAVVSGSFTPLPTARVFDGTATTSPRLVQIAGVGGVPAGATAVMVNTEVFNPSASGYVRVTPAGLDAGVATQEFGRGQAISNLVAVQLVGGRMQVKVSAGSARILMDVAGYYSATTGASFTPLPTARVFDGSAGTSPRLVQVAGVGGVPVGATAVMVNTEVFAPSAAGYVRVTPAGLDAGVATQEFGRGQAISNLVAVQLVGGRVQVKVSAGSARVLMDVAGYYSATTGASFTPLPTARVFDGSAGTSPRQVQITGTGGVPAGATAVVVNTEVFGPSAAGYVRVTPAGLDAGVATQEFARGQAISNLVAVQLVGGRVQVKVSAGSARVLMDVAGYYSAAAPVATPPGPVTALRATPATTSIALAWANPADASLTGVMIRRLAGGTPPSSATAGTLVIDAAKPATSYTDAGLAPGTQYSYALFAHDGVPNYANPAAKSVTTASAPDTTPPGPVTNLTATPTSSSVALSWSNPSDADFAGVVIRRAVGATPPASATAGTLVTDAAKPATSYTDIGLAPGTQYSYALFAHDGVPNYANPAAKSVTTASAPDTTPPGPVTNLTATPTSSSVALSWSNPSDADFAGVVIRRELGAIAPATATTGTLVTDTAKTATSFTDTGLAPGTAYSYAVFAHDGVPNYAGPALLTAATTTPADTTAPGPVTALHTTTITTTSVGLAWTNPADPDFTGVLIRRAAGPTPPATVTDGDPVTTTGTTATSFTDTNLAPGTTYTYALFAHDGVPNYAAATTLSTGTPASAAPVHLCGLLDGDQTWDPAIAPVYILDCTITIPAGVTLTVHPGTIIKASSGATLQVDGSLVASGTAGSPVVFTSLADDSVGGDTNGDGSATAPALIDWNGVSVSGPGVHGFDFLQVKFARLTLSGGSSTSLTHAQVGGAVSVDATSGPVTVTDNIVGQGLRVDQAATPGATTVSRNTIAGTGSWYGLEVNTGTNVGTPGATVQDNTVTASNTAIYVHGSHLVPAQLTGNTASGNTMNVLALSGHLSGNLSLPMVGPPVVVLFTGDFYPALTVDAGATLSLVAGQVIKFGPGGGLQVDGSLVASGTAGSPVVFTSLADDSVGGDTNGDGSASSPAAGDWYGITVGTAGSATLQNVILRYAATALSVSDGGYAVVHGSILNSQVGVSSNTWVDATNVNWGDPSGPSPIGTGTPVAGQGVLVVPWVGYVAPPLPPRPQPTPVSLPACSDYVFIGVRGSGEPPQNGDPYSSDEVSNMGARTAGIYNAFLSRLQKNSTETGNPVPTVKTLGLRYPAMDVPGGLSLAVVVGSNAFIDSAWDGVYALEDEISYETSRCSNEHVILAGYSQGALAIHLAIGYLSGPESDRISAILLLADPAKTGDGGETALGSATPSIPGIYTNYINKIEMPSSLAGLTASMCNDQDIVCANAFPSGPWAHTSYSTELTTLGEWGADVVRPPYIY
jgi:Cutinase/Fibronectin type III domain